MNQTYSIHTLENGLKVAYCRRNGNVSYCGLAVNAGSRDEPEHLYGLAHFVEHTIFKGTRKRRSWHILNRMERVGGELNAYTTKEETLVYSVFPSGYMERAVELIADLVMNSVFPEKEIEKEKAVVSEEICSYRDTPSEAIYDEFEDLVFGGSALGHNILGSEDTLARIGSEDCRRYLKSLYVPRNMVLFAVGDIAEEKMFRIAERHFAPMHHELLQTSRRPAESKPRFTEIKDIGSHQAHTIIGSPVFGMHDPRKYALLLFNNLLGGPGMNSLLNVAIRERRGYAYTVESAAALYSDGGLFSVYFGSDAGYVKKCLQIIRAEIGRIASGGLKPAALEAAKKQYAGQLLVSGDNLESYALALGKGILNFGKSDSINEIAEKIRNVTGEEIRAVAEEIESNCSSLTFL